MCVICPLRENSERIGVGSKCPARVPEPFQSPSKGIVLAALALVFVEERLASFTSWASRGPPVIGKEAIKP